MTWYAFDRGYPTLELIGPQIPLADLVRFHGYPDKATAEQHRNSVDPLNLPQFAVLNDLIAASKITHIPAAVGGAVGGALSGLGKWSLHSVGDFHQVMLRAVEIILGLILIGIGAVKLSSGAASQIAKIPGYGKAIGALAA